MKREGKEKISGKSGELLISLAPFSAVVAVKDSTPTPTFLFEFIEPPTPADGAGVLMGEIIIITVNVCVTADTLEDEVNTVWLNWTDGYNFTEAMMPMVDDLTWSLNVTEMMGEEITEGTYYYTVYANDIWNNTGVSPTRTVNVTAVGLKGDVNGDNKVTGIDAMKIKQHIVGLITLTPEQLSRGDVNDDDKVTGIDAMKIKQSIVGLIPKWW